MSRRSTVVRTCGGFLLCALLSPSWTLAQEVVVEGQASIRNGDMGQARELALQRALGQAAASGSARISSVAQSQPGTVQDSTRLSATACTKSSRILGESINGDQLTLSVAVTLDQAPEPFLLPSDKESRFVSLAKARRAQYVISGIYRDFAIRRGWLTFSKRAIVIDIYIHDGANGALLTQRRFSRTASGEVALKTSPPIGSEAFYATDLGRAWGALLDEIAIWATDSAACLPFIARVLKVDGAQIFLDIGAEASVAAGNALRLHAWKEPSVMTSSGLLLGQEKQLGVKLNLKLVYPGFSIAEVAEAGFSLKIRPGDLLYLQ
jgi:hypothetical protein